jgi:hypothetical protein
LFSALGVAIFLSVVVHPVITENLLAGYLDFTSFYAAGKIVKEGAGERLYDYRTQAAYQADVGNRPAPLLFNHAPFESLLFVPLAWFSLLAAYRIWAFINLGLLVLCSYLIRDYLENLNSLAARVVFVLSSSLPALVALVQGQDSFLLLLGYVLAFLSLKQERNFRAGGILALGVFKPQLVFPFLVVFLVRRNWRILAGFLTISTALLVVSLGITGWEGFRNWPDLIRYQDSGSAGAALHSAKAILPPAMANMRGVLSALLTGVIPEGYLNLLIALISLSLLGWGVSQWRGRQDVGSRDFDLRFAFSVFITLLVSYHLYFHDLILAGLPILLVLHHMESAGSALTTRRVALFAALLVWFGIPLYVMGHETRSFYPLAAVMLVLAALTSAEIRVAGRNPRPPSA